MKDHKALQSGTSHYFEDKFSRAYDVTFTGRDNKLQYPFQTSWGSTTRLIGACIMTHSATTMVWSAPAIAPIQVVVPVAQHKPGVLDAAAALRDRLTALELRVKMDDSDKSPGWKYAQYEMKGVPLRVEIGPKDMEKRQCCIARRTPARRCSCPWRTLEATGAGPAEGGTRQPLRHGGEESGGQHLRLHPWEEVTGAWLRARAALPRTKWCGSLECELAMKEKAGVSSRCMPLKRPAPWANALCAARNAPPISTGAWRIDAEMPLLAPRNSGGRFDGLHKKLLKKFHEKSEKSP